MSNYRKAPPGFTLRQWQQFQDDGFIVIENALSQTEIDDYLAAIERVANKDDKYTEGGYYGIENIVERDPTLANVIDHPRHVGFAYDIYGELLKLHQTQVFLRTPQPGHNNKWHPDGARALPYGVFAPRLPLQIKIGYWLTDLPEEQMGNLVVLPGSHRKQTMDAYDTHEKVKGQHVLKVKRGTMTIMHSNIWHQVQANNSDVTRKNIFIAYCPAWLTNADRHNSDPAWLETLNREQRIIMRSYDHAYSNAKPPASEFPLFLNRDGSDRDEGVYQDHVALGRRKRITQAEKFEKQLEQVPA
mgnify:CR=1 FL=1